jgi:hypothetical protein
MLGGQDLSAQAILKEAADLGVSVSLDGEHLSLKAAQKPPPALLAALQKHKSKILSLLRSDCCTEPNEAALEERAALASGSVPEQYLDAWARLQCQKPRQVSVADWRQAIDAARRFLDKWGSIADTFGWSPGDLFDVPREGRPGGLAWFLAGETVRALGPEHAITTSDRVYDRLTRAEWVNPYRRIRK